METIQTDVAIIGAGGAGLRAAIALAETDPKLRIALISKVYPMRSHTCAAEGGAAGVIKPDDSFDTHFDDTVGGGDWLSDQDCVEYFVHEAPKELLQLEHWGCPWNREPDGSVAVRPFGGMKKKRTWFAADKSGFHILHTLFQTSLQFDSIKRYDEYFALDLLVDDGRCQGLTAMDMRSGQLRQFHAKAVIIAGGGAGRMFPFTTNGAIKTGDGMAMAYRAGVPLKDMEFVQFHPTGLRKLGILVSEAVRGEGGILRNGSGERFMERYAPTIKDLAPRDMVARAMVREVREGYTKFRETQTYREPILAFYRSLYLFPALLILFGAVWLALYLARRITTPLRLVAEGAQRIASGERGVRVDFPSNSEESRALVASFNRMSERLARSEEEVEFSRGGLVRKNQELEERRRLTETVLETVGTGVVVVDQDAVVTAVNAAAQRLLELDAGTVGLSLERVLRGPVVDRTAAGEMAQPGLG